MKTVYVAMSGGVDSSVAAALLKKEGFNVIGVYFKPWSPSKDVSYCDWKDDRETAMRVASVLKIKFKTWDFSKEYGDIVVKYMIDSYRKGLTPNPDVMCNKEIKFGLFLKKALSEGADFIATGHYVRKNGLNLLMGVDSNKDQSYFLWTLTEKQLKYCFFPIGRYTKPEVRKLAKKFGLSNYNKKDSQGICFVGQLDVKSFLKKYIKPKTGNIVLADNGKVIGQHDGVYYYTIGQRHGLNIKNGAGPYFVVNKNVKNKIIYVTNNRSGNFKKTAAVIEKINWITKKPDLPIKIQIKIRYRNKSFPAILSKGNIKKSFIAKFLEPVNCITPGQSAVFYDKNRVLGGGVIRRDFVTQE